MGMGNVIKTMKNVMVQRWECCKKKKLFLDNTYARMMLINSTSAAYGGGGHENVEFCGVRGYFSFYRRDGSKYCFK